MKGERWVSEHLLDSANIRAVTASERGNFDEPGDWLVVKGLTKAQADIITQAHNAAIESIRTEA